MAFNEGTKAKLQAVLGAIPPHMRETLSRMIAEARKTGSSDQVFDLLSEVLGLSDCESEPAATETSITAFDIFNQVLGPFLISEQLSRKVQGRIFDQVIPTLWTWISKDLVAPGILKFEVERSITSGALRTMIAKEMSDVVVSARGNPDVRRKYIGRAGGERNFEEFEDIAIIMRRAKEIERFDEILTEMEGLNDSALIPQLARLVTEMARIDSRFPHYIAVLIHLKTGTTAKLPKIAVTGAGSEDVKAIASSPYFALIDIVLAETERASMRVLNGLRQLKPDGTLSPALREFAMTSRNLRALLNLDQTNHEWSRRLTEMRSKLSEGITRELSDLPRLVRASVKTLRAFDQRKLGLPDPVDVDKAYLLLELLAAARLSSTELGVNETILRVASDSEAYLDHTTRILAEDARNAMGDQRNTVRAYGEVATRMTELLHGTARANTLRRSLGTALGGSGEPATPVRAAL